VVNDYKSLFTVLKYKILYIYIILIAPCFKKYFKIRSWVPSPQMPYFKQSTGHTHTTHTTKTKTTQATLKHQNTHTHTRHSRNDERQRLSSCCQSRRRRHPQDRRRWFDARRAAEGGDVVGLTVRSMSTVATRRPRRQPAMRPTQAHLLTLSLLPTRGTGHPPRENDLYRSS